MEAELSEPLSDNAWVQWKLDWDVEAEGRYLITCRATDGLGEVQTDEIRPPAPDGASGWHTRRVVVDA
jgi:hypothetical protein